VSRLINILFPELERLVSTLHAKTIYELLSEFPGAHQIASANLKHLTALIEKASKGHFGREKANEIREAARRSISSFLPAKSLELKHTIKLIRELTAEIDEIETEIKRIMDAIDSPILSVPGISYSIGSMIVSEIGDFSRFDSPDKILAYAGCSPTTYQSGQLYSSHAAMEKRGSKYLRWALINAARYVCSWEPTFASYLEKKRSEGKHYYVALSHAAKKLVRLLYHLEITGEKYKPNFV
jgi:transposase